MEKWTYRKPIQSVSGHDGLDEGGVGGAAFASTCDKPMLADWENGAKYFSLRGISMDVAEIEECAGHAQIS